MSKRNKMEKRVFAGLSGVSLDLPEIPLGYGVKLTNSYAHLFAPFMMAFSPAPKGAHHPPPWVAVRGGFSFDLTVQLEIPGSTVETLAIDPMHVAWWITAMLRLRVGPTLLVPVIGEQSFQSAKERNSNAVYHPIETESQILVLDTEGRRNISETDAAWVAKYWVEASALYQSSDGFRTLLEAADQSMFVRHRSLALLSLWGGLEAIFSPDKAELRYRVSAGLATYLEPAGIPRMNAQKAIAKLYDSRSSAAHGREDKRADSLQATYSLARRALVKMIEENRVPTHIELEAKLFGADPS
jgi:hypothetical protein